MARLDLKWCFKDVPSLIHPYAKTGELHVILPGQEDKATPDPYGVPWILDGDRDKDAD